MGITKYNMYLTVYTYTGMLLNKRFHRYYYKFYFEFRNAASKSEFKIQTTIAVRPHIKLGFLLSIELYKNWYSPL